MKKNLPIPILFLLMSLHSQALLAHPGHGKTEIDGYSLLHFLSEPIHLFSIGIIVLTLYLVIRKVVKVGKARQRKDS